MSKERIGAFIDAVLAIVITILVLDLKKPTDLTFAGFWAMRENYFAYAISFFWIGVIWALQISSWGCFERLDGKCVIWILFMLFFSSLFPYCTSIVADHIYDFSAETFYGLISLATTLCGMMLSHQINKVNQRRVFGWLYDMPKKIVICDLAIKIVGFLIAMAGWPPAIIFSLLINIVFRLAYLLRREEMETCEVPVRPAADKKKSRNFLSGR